jgi:hypothetical protein
MQRPSNDRALRLCVALIHNNNEQRNALVRPNIDRLRAELSSLCSIETLEISYQTPIQPHGILLALRRDILKHRLEYEWRQYRQLESSVFRDFLGSIKSLEKKYLSRDTKSRDRWRRSSAIEVMVTDKHIRAWDRFLELDCDLLICLEDDAVFKPDSIEQFAAVIHEIATLEPQSNLYVDLAGGCSLSDLQIAHLVQRKKGFLTFYERAVTNTACAYLLSKPLVASFKAALVRLPALRLIGIDWMINKLLIELHCAGGSCICFHADPTVFKHGSTTGDFQAWER